MKRHIFKPKAKIHVPVASSSSDEDENDQEHARVRSKGELSSMTSEPTTSTSNFSVSSSINRFRTDFDDLKCKMRIFGESLNLCRCIASDFREKLNTMERRLENLERREKITRSASNYSAIIQKNKFLSNRTLLQAKASTLISGIY